MHMHEAVLSLALRAPSLQHASIVRLTHGTDSKKTAAGASPFPVGQAVSSLMGNAMSTSLTLCAGYPLFRRSSSHAFSADVGKSNLCTTIPQHRVGLALLYVIEATPPGVSGRGRRKGSAGVEQRKMTSRDQKKAVLHEKLQLLRSVTNSGALSKASIIVDASKYIQELKQKVEACKRDLEEESSLPMVTVETLEKGFWINVFSDKNCPGMLVSVLQAFQELGLDVLDATISSADSFRLEAVGGEPQNESVDAQMVRQVVVQAIKKCMGG